MKIRPRQRWTVSANDGQTAGRQQSAVWCGAVWCGAVWCGAVWCGAIWCGAMVQGQCGTAYVQYVYVRATIRTMLSAHRGRSFRVEIHRQGLFRRYGPALRATIEISQWTCRDALSNVECRISIGVAGRKMRITKSALIGRAMEWG